MDKHRNSLASLTPSSFGVVGSNGDSAGNSGTLSNGLIVAGLIVVRLFNSTGVLIIDWSIDCACFLKEELHWWADPFPASRMKDLQKTFTSSLFSFHHARKGLALRALLPVLDDKISGDPLAV